MPYDRAITGDDWPREVATAQRVFRVAVSYPRWWWILALCVSFVLSGAGVVGIVLSFVRPGPGWTMCGSIGFASMLFALLLVPGCIAAVVCLRGISQPAMVLTEEAVTISYAFHKPTVLQWSEVERIMVRTYRQTRIPWFLRGRHNFLCLLIVPRVPPTQWPKASFVRRLVARLTFAVWGVHVAGGFREGMNIPLLELTIRLGELSGIQPDISRESWAMLERSR